MEGTTGVATEEIVGEENRQIDQQDYADLVRLFQERRSRLVRAALRITRNQEDAEDVVQEAALRALVSLPKFRHQSRIETWVYTIVGNAALDRFRRPALRRNLSLDGAMADPHNSHRFMSSDESLSPEQCCARKEIDTIVRSEIEDLRLTHKTAVQLCDFEGCSYGEAAAVLNLSIPRFKARLYRGRRVLGQRVRQRVSGQTR